MARHPPVGGVHTKMRLDSMEKFFGSQGLTSLPGKLQLACTYTCCYVQYYTGRHPASLCNICITLTLHCALSMQYRWLHAIVLCCALPWWAATAASASQQIGKFRRVFCAVASLHWNHKRMQRCSMLVTNVLQARGRSQTKTSSSTVARAIREQHHRAFQTQHLLR